MAEWFVRPDASHSGSRNGQTYDTAWGGWSEIVWGASGVYGVNDDTLYVCGAHSYSAIISVGPHLGTVSHRATIRGDYVTASGSITFTAGTYNLTCSRDYTTIRNLRINAGDYGCVVLGNVALTGVWIFNNYLIAAGTATGSLLRFQAFTGWSYTDCIIDGNMFSGGSGSAGGSAIQWYATAAGSITSLTNLQISNNTFTGCSGGRGTIQLEALDTVHASTKMADIVVSGNTFTGCSSVMLFIYGPAEYGRNTGIRVCDNVIRNQTAVGIVGGGMSLGGFGPSLTSGFGSNVVARNEAYDLNGITGFINLFYGTYRVFGNYADGIDTPDIDGNGVLFDHGCDGCEVFGNELHNIRGKGVGGYESGFGILVLDATNCTAYGNIVDGCVTGVAFGGKGAGQSSNVFNNTFRNCSQSGAYVGGANLTNNLVRNNIFTSAGGTVPAVNNFTGTWTGESGNCFNGFGPALNHTLHASTVTVDPELDGDYRPGSALKRTGTYLGGRDFSSKHFYDPPNIGAVDELTTTPRYALRSR